MSLLECQGLTVHYGKKENQKIALPSLDISIEEKEFVTIMGKSGCGKSTLLHVLSGIHKPDNGIYNLEEENVYQLSRNALAEFRNRKIGLIVQQFALIADMNVMDNIILPLQYRKMDKMLRYKLANELLEKLQIADKKYQFPYELSGGEAQRVAIARAMITKPKLLLADEPTGALDEVTGQAIMQVLDEIHEEGTTIIMVTHDKELAERGTRKLMMKDGQFISDIRQ
mgnify:CR=1 FL=1